MEYHITNQADFEQYRHHRFNPGDLIYFARGMTFTGQFAPQGCGTERAPIRVLAAGQGAKPVIVGGEADVGAFVLRNQDYWEVDGLELNGGVQHAFLADFTDPTRIYFHLHLNDITVQKMCGMVSGENGGGRTAGIAVLTLDAVKLRNVRITHCTVSHINWWAGITVMGYASSHDANWGADTPWAYDRIEDILIAHCTVHHVLGNGITTMCCTRSLITHCVAHHNGGYEGSDIGQTPVAIWHCFAKDSVISHCEAYAQTTWQRKPGADGGGFDIDYSCINSVIEYNYAHDNYGAGLLLCGVDWAFGEPATVNSVVRYNHFANNGNHPDNTETDIYVHQWGDNGSFNGVQVYNNVIYWNPANKALPAFCNDGTYAGMISGELPNVFRDNVIYSTVPLMIDCSKEFALAGNQYFHVDGAEAARWKHGGTVYEGWEAYSAGGVEQNPRYSDEGMAWQTSG